MAIHSANRHLALIYLRPMRLNALHFKVGMVSDNELSVPVGPVLIPKKGSPIDLNASNISLYERAIRVYENNVLEVKDGKIFINGMETTQYTFKMNYYWMMGDNRQDSQDSRYWGFVPEDHVVGEAWLIWMSWDKGIRWKRMFNTIH